MPENSPKENDFFYWGLMTVKPGHMKAVEDGFKKFVQLMTEHEVAHAWNAAVGGIGTEGPVVAYLEWGASPGAFFTRVDEIQANEELAKASVGIPECTRAGDVPVLSGFARSGSVPGAHAPGLRSVAAPRLAVRAACPTGCHPE
jgi:hypothetical protein